MNKYIIEQEIDSLLKNHYFEWQKSITSFEFEWITFSEKNYSYWEWAFWNKWIINCELEWENYKDVLNIYSYKISKIIPKISFIGQAYINYNYWSLLVKKWDIWLFFYRYNNEPVWLNFWKNKQDILLDLYYNKDIPQEFFSYWYDLINTTSYTWKILLLCCSIESLLPKKHKWKTLNKEQSEHNKEVNKLRKKIIWNDLDNDLFWRDDKWLRHRIIHWEYFSPEDFKKNYVVEIHNRIIDYFNKEIINIDEKIPLWIIDPQRNLFINYKGQRCYLKWSKKFELNIVNLLDNIKQDRILKFNEDTYKIVSNVDNF